MTDIIILDKWQDAPPEARQVIPYDDNKIIRHFAAVGTPVKSLYRWQSKLTTQWYMAWVVLEAKR